MESEGETDQLLFHLKNCSLVKVKHVREMTLFHLVKHYYAIKRLTLKTVRFYSAFLHFIFFIVFQISHNKSLFCEEKRHLNPD